MHSKDVLSCSISHVIAATDNIGIPGCLHMVSLNGATLTFALSFDIPKQLSQTPPPKPGNQFSFSTKSRAFFTPSHPRDASHEMGPKHAGSQEPSPHSQKLSRRRARIA